MKKYILAVAVIAALIIGFGQTDRALKLVGISSSRSDAIASAFKEHRSGVQVTGEGIVTKILKDDNDGSRHQRFILSMASGQTLLVAHNIDIAPRLTALKTGDSVAFNGVYEWNEKGGVIHWTHHDPTGRHSPGWLKHGDQTVQ
jgi:hypothetical protein